MRETQKSLLLGKKCIALKSDLHIRGNFFPIQIFRGVLSLETEKNISKENK